MQHLKQIHLIAFCSHNLLPRSLLSGLGFSFEHASQQIPAFCSFLPLHEPPCHARTYLTHAARRMAAFACAATEACLPVLLACSLLWCWVEPVPDGCHVDQHVLLPVVIGSLQRPEAQGHQQISQLSHIAHTLHLEHTQQFFDKIAWRYISRSVGQVAFQE